MALVRWGSQSLRLFGRSVIFLKNVHDKPVPGEQKFPIHNDIRILKKKILIETNTKPPMPFSSPLETVHEEDTKFSKLLPSLLRYEDHNKWCKGGESKTRRSGREFFHRILAEATSFFCSGYWRFSAINQEKKFFFVCLFLVEFHAMVNV